MRVNGTGRAENQARGGESAVPAKKGEQDTLVTLGSIKQGPCIAVYLSGHPGVPK